MFLIKKNYLPFFLDVFTLNDKHSLNVSIMNLFAEKQNFFTFAIELWKK